MRNFSLIVFTAFLSFGGGFLAAQSLPLPAAKHKLVVIAHRGSHLKVPENTLAAYETAINEGADYVEIDLRTTKDGHLVIMHDESATRMTGKEADIKDLNYSDIKELRIKPAGKEDTTTYRIPDFESVLNLCKGKINIYLDFKEANVSQAYRLIKKFGMQNHVVVYLNKEEQYGQWKNVAPDMPLMASIPEKMDSTKLNSSLDKMRLDVVDNAHDNRMVSLLHNRKISVWLDVQGNDEKPEKWDQALKLGVDGLQTNHPEDLIKYLQSRGIR